MFFKKSNHLNELGFKQLSEPKSQARSRLRRFDSSAGQRRPPGNAAKTLSAPSFQLFSKLYSPRRQRARILPSRQIEGTQS
jgi:hypothetical protein